MKRKGRLLVIFLIVAGLVAAITLDPAARVQGWIGGEPFFQGRSATAWQNDLKQTDEAARAASITTLTQGKGEAIPVCVWLLQKSAEPTIRLTAADILGKMGKDGEAAGPALVASLKDPDPMVREVVIVAVGKLAPNVPGAVPALIALFPKDLAIRAVAEFKKSGAEAVPVLVPLLTHPETRVRWNAGRTLGKLGDPSLPAVPALVTQLETDKESLVREHAAEALGDIGPKAAAEYPSVVPALAKALKDEDKKVRRDAVRSLGQIGAASKPVITDVKALLDDPIDIVRDAAKETVRRIGP